jgi:hypothetical protein
MIVSVWGAGKVHFGGRGISAEVGKMKIVYLLPLSISSIQHVGNIIYLKKRVGSFGFC